MLACTLDIGSRRVLVSEEGPPAAEFVLFDPSDIELAPSEGGPLREAGYRTTAADAVRRLAVAGVTVGFATECAMLVHGRIAEAYARGPLVRRLSSLLGPAELFDGGTYDTTLRRYDGTWLDLPLLTNDAGIASATGILHAAALATLLSEVRGDTPVVLSTLGHAESLRLGERTLRRHAVDNVASVPRALRHLAEHAPAPQTGGQGPSRETFSAMLKARLAACASAEARDHLERLERALSERSRPSHGPLSAQSMWEVERLLNDGDLPAALRRIDALEGSHGREPATVYLRARLALIQGRESPRAIAQRIAEMALSMPDFPEVELLAAQAWNAAGETKNALPFARDLATNPRVPADLRAAAESILRAPRVPVDAPMGERDFESSGGELRPISQRPPPPPVQPPEPEIRIAPETSSASPIARSVPPPQVVVHDSRTDLPLSRTPTERPPARTLTPPAVAPRSAPPPVVVNDVRRYLTPPERIASPLPPRSARPSAPPASAPVTPRSPGTVPPAAAPRPPSEPPVTPRPMSARAVQPAPWPTARRAPREERARPEDIEHTPSRAVSQKFMRGASMPPLASVPPGGIPRPPVVPRVDIDEPELIETLPLPRGASDAAIDAGVVPRSPLEARIRFTMDARELARRYRHEDGIELRLELRAISVMQNYLTRRFDRHVVSTPEEAREAELHGALLSELLARLLDAEWTDISPSELGYWAMTTPSRGVGDKAATGKRVWPFGRVLRFIASGGEDDLVMFFKKLRELG
ncbi:MAG: hypothetical protein ACLQVI_36910 [Polyangiaceae bacterium]